MFPSNRFLTVLAVLAATGCTTDVPSAPNDSSAVHSPVPSAEHTGTSHSKGHQRTANLNKQLAELRRVTASFHNFDKAVEAGYVAQITPCWESRTRGAMGYHYGNPALIDGSVSLLEPEALLYEPGPSGQLRLVGMEYIVPLADWEGASPPTLLGQEFHEHSFLPIYKLHVWLWRNNPRGMFADWNPKVSCEHAAETEYFE